MKVDGIGDLEREIFGPVLHVASFRARDIDKVVDAINARGYGLTFGLHTRIDDRVQQIVERIHVGNAYVNRNQIGAIVGIAALRRRRTFGHRAQGRRAALCQPVPAHRAGGRASGADRAGRAARDAAARPLRTRRPQLGGAAGPGRGPAAGRCRAAAASCARRSPPRPRSTRGPFTLPGPTGESNRLSLHPRGPVLCLGPTPEIALAQAAQALAAGCGVVIAVPGAGDAVRPLATIGAPVAALDGTVEAASLTALDGLAAVAAAGRSDWTAGLRRALAAATRAASCRSRRRSSARRASSLERHLCIDTTAAGGNASLLAAVA